MTKKTIKNLNLFKKTIFCRVDYNVPINKGAISDDLRIKASLPTLKYLLQNNCKILLATHLGRPKGLVIESLRLNLIADRLQEILGFNINKSDYSSGNGLRDDINKLNFGEILLLENIRFNADEEHNDETLAKEWASYADIYVNDAFGTVHRAHASNSSITKYLPSYAGLLLSKELTYLDKFLNGSEAPFTAIMGGAKIRDKIGVINNLLEKVNNLLIGGGLAFTFLAAKGFAVGKSVLEKDKLDIAKNILGSTIKIVLPIDVVISDSIDNPTRIETVPVDNIPSWGIGLDVGPDTIALFDSIIQASKTVFWNGPLGLFENDEFAKGTLAIADSVATSNSTSIVGGGDSVAALKKSGKIDEITHVSTGGGASLEFIEGKELPGLKGLLDKKHLIVANWKMYKNRKEINDFFDSLSVHNYKKENEIIFCPPSVFLNQVIGLTNNLENVSVGAQNLSSELEGAYTGEISASMLASIGVKYTILGHSERRKYFKETNELINKKVKVSFSQNIIPIICIGETLEEREQQNTTSVIEQQVKAAISGIDSLEIIFAYEPVWAIGTGLTANCKDVESVADLIREVVMTTKRDVQVKVLYGGSVNENNISTFTNISSVDGVLIGGASLFPSKLVEMINKV